MTTIMTSAPESASVSPLSTITTSVLLPAFVSLVVALFTLYVFQPIRAQKQLIEEIDSATDFYRRATSKVRADWKDPQAAKAKAEEATEALFMLSARLGASPATFPARGKYYKLFELPRLVEKRENISNASSALSSWAYSIRMGDNQAAQRYRSKVIKALNLSRD